MTVCQLMTGSKNRDSFRNIEDPAFGDCYEPFMHVFNYVNADLEGTFASLTEDVKPSVRVNERHFHEQIRI